MNKVFFGKYAVCAVSLSGTSDSQLACQETGNHARRSETLRRTSLIFGLEETKKNGYS